MKKQLTKPFQIVIATFSTVAMLSACAKDEITSSNPTSQEDEIVQVESGVLTFNSTDDLARQIEALQESDSYDVKSLPVTRAGNTPFISLRDKLIADAMQDFSPEELQQIEEEDLVFEPEDELIIDPYLMSVLNANREVMIGDKMYRYVAAGLVEYVPTRENIETVDQISGNGSATRSANIHGQIQYLGSGIKLTTIAYSPFEERTEVPETRASGLNANGSITLEGGINIPTSQIAKALYGKNNGSGSWLQKSVSNVFGTNITIDNHFDKKHRTKLRLYDQDYVLYRAVGMTVRMQRRRLGIWWRIKAQEFRYGWTAMEVAYEYKNPPFNPLPYPEGMKVPNNAPTVYDIPTTMSKKFPFANSDIVLFRALNYNVTTGNINTLFAAGMKALARTIQDYVKQNPSHANNPQGLFNPYDESKKIAVVYPQGEEVAYNDGREVVRWDLTWWSGNFVAGFSNDLSGSLLKPGNWRRSNLVFKAAVDTEIKRGQIYGAVRYNNVWKACVIESRP